MANDLCDYVIQHIQFSVGWPTGYLS